MPARIAPEVSDLIVSFDHPVVDPSSVFDLAIELRRQFMVAPHRSTRRLTMVCIHLVAALSHLRTEPTNRTSVELLERQITTLRTMREPQLSVLVEWYLGVAMLLQEFPPGIDEPVLHTRALDEIAAQFLNVGKLAVAQGNHVRASLASSLAAEVMVYGSQPALAVQFSLAAAKYDTGEEHALLEIRRRINPVIIQGEGAVRPPMAMDYGTYLYIPGELLAVLDTK